MTRVMRGGALRRPAALRGAFVLLAAAIAVGLPGCSLAPSGRSITVWEPPPASEPILDVAVLTEASTVTVRGLRLRWALDSVRALDRVGAGFRVLNGPRDSTGFEVTLDGPLAPGDTLRVSSADAEVSVAGRAYRGGLKLFRNPRGQLTVVNRVPLEAYLRGVLPNEISCGRIELLEAMKAQAIAARTYAVAMGRRHPLEGYDLVSTVMDQVYAGIPAEKEFGNRAIHETAGVVATWEGRPIRMYYASTCGGRTAARDEVWEESPLPYLRGVSDEGGDGLWCASSRYARWTESWDGVEFVDIVRAGLAAESFGSLPTDAVLRDVRVAKRSESGRVDALEFDTSAGRFTARKDRIRWVVRRPDGQGLLRSTLFDVTVRKSHGRVESVTIAGRGWGHGIGLCQVGAMERARRGQSHEKILKHYYHGIELSRWYLPPEETAAR